MTDLLKIFGFGHNMSKGEVQFDPKETNIFRYRLYARAIRINGLSQMQDLYPYLHKRLLNTFDDLVEPQCVGNSTWQSHIPFETIKIKHADRLDPSPYHASDARPCYWDAWSLSLWGDSL